jgi:hypothetical protein
VQASLLSALSRLPLVNGATAGRDPAAPDAAALRAVLRRGCDAAARMRPALRRLLGPGATTTHNNPTTAATTSTTSTPSTAADAPSVATTASYARELIDLACEEVRRLGLVRARLEALADAALYAGSLRAQLAQMRGAGAGPGSGLSGVLA